MSTEIKYNGQYPFSGQGIVEGFGDQVEMIVVGERWAQKHNLKIAGNITGQCAGFSGLLARQRQIISGFGKDFQTLQIIENGSVLTGYDAVKITNISFPTNSYLGLVPFLVEAECYPSGYYSGTYGILDPKEEIVISESDDGIATITHTISARGIETSSATSNALSNAKNWVQSRTGTLINYLYPTFIYNSTYSPCLRSQQESIDRFNGTYEIKQNYIADLLLTNGGYLRFTTEFNSGVEDGISTVAVNGNYVACAEDFNLGELRQNYLDFDAFGEAANAYYKITNRSDLQQRFVSRGVSENTSAFTISFSYLFNNDSRPKYSFSYGVDFSFDFEADIITASIKGAIDHKNNQGEDIWLNMKVLASQIDLYSIVVPFFNSYVNTVAPYLSGFVLNPNPTSYKRSENEFERQISLEASYSNQTIPPYGLQEFDYTIGVTPSIRKYSANPLLNGTGQYIIYDLGYNNRAICSIDLKGVGNDSTTREQTEDILKKQAFKLQSQFLSGTRRHLESQSIIRSNASFEKSISINASYTSEENRFTF